MLYRYQYHGAEEKEEIMSANSTLFLVEQQNITEGDFLVFSDELLPRSIVYTRVPLDEFEDLKNKNEELRAKNEALGLTVDSILTDVIPSLFG